MKQEPVPVFSWEERRNEIRITATSDEGVAVIAYKDRGFLSVKQIHLRYG